jgi:cold shock CspA family protein
MSSPNTVIGTGSSRVIGCVKFFDKNAGFGFISVLKNADFVEFSEKDIFVHYSGIHIENQQYKYLVKGEYVEFKIVPSTKPNVSTDDDNNDKFNAVDITGIQGGKLMCETNYNEYIPKANRPQTFYDENVMDIDVVSNNVRQPTYYNGGRGSGGRGGGRGGGGRGEVQYVRINNRTTGPSARVNQQKPIRTPKA